MHSCNYLNPKTSLTCQTIASLSTSCLHTYHMQGCSLSDCFWSCINTQHCSTKKSVWQDYSPKTVVPVCALITPLGFDQNILRGVQLKHSVLPVQSIWRIVRVGGCPTVMAQWQSASSSSQRCLGLDSWQQPAFSSSLHIFSDILSAIYENLWNRSTSTYTP